MTPFYALVRRELLRNLRSVRAVLCLSLLVGIAIAVAVLYWPDDPYTRAGTASAALFAGIVGILGVGALLFVPGIAAVAITTERESETYEQLFTTLLSPPVIVAAHLINALGLYVLMLLGAMPVMSVVLFLVGIDAIQIVASVLFLLATATVCAAVGLFASVLAPNSLVSTLVAYAGTILTLFVPFRLYQALYAFGSGAASASGSFSSVGLFVWMIAFLAVTSGAFLVATARLMRRPPRPRRVPKEKPIDDPRLLLRRRECFPYYLIDPLKRKPPLEDDANPILMRELRYGLALRGAAFIRATVGSLFVFSLLGFHFANPIILVSDDYEASIRFLMLLESLLALLIVPALATRAFTREFEAERADLLRSTLVTPAEMVVGKLFAGMAALSPFMLGITISILLVGLYTIFIGRGGGALFTGFLTLLLSVWLAVSISLFAAVRSKRSLQATVRSYTLLALVCGSGFGVLALQEAGLFGLERGSHFAIRLSPILSYLALNQGVDSGEHIAVVFMFAVLGMIAVGLALHDYTTRRMRDV